ncbi:MAG: ribosome maturation factor RimM [Campylobacter sp.]|nr:ribosome maturation factor RimM [Campylobacter sp.]
MNNDKNLFEVALLGRTIGLKGALKLHNRSDFLSQFKKNAKFFLKTGKILEIKSFNKESMSVIFSGYESVELAKILTNQLIYQDEATTRKTCKLQKDEFFYFDIIGLEVFEDSIRLGSVVDILEVGINYLFLVEADESLSEFSSSFYIPYNDNFIERISLAESKIYTKNSFEILKNS